ncbi:MAG TPA: hypothetical protein VHD31_01010 [Candidatus Paceibacterota bacterium]|nr:hypothetical protein [Candidatus Paceibacterota bacterium]
MARRYSVRAYRVLPHPDQKFDNSPEGLKKAAEEYASPDIPAELHTLEVILESPAGESRTINLTSSRGEMVVSFSSDFEKVLRRRN